MRSFKDILNMLNSEEGDSTYIAAFGPDTENANPNTGKPNPSSAFKPSKSPRKPAATEMEEKFQSPSRIAGQNPESDGFYPFSDTIGKQIHRGVHGFFSPQKGEDGRVYFSQSNIHGPSAIELAQLLKGGWGVKPNNGEFQDPVNLVIFNDGSIVSFDHRRCWAAAQNGLRVPYIMHHENDVFINPNNGRKYKIKDQKTQKLRFKTWGEAIWERCNHKKNEEGFEGSKELPTLRGIKPGDNARIKKTKDSPCGRRTATRIR